MTIGRAVAVASLLLAAPLTAQTSRVLRVLDSTTSKPVAFAEVRDVASGRNLRTAQSGLVTVQFAGRDTKRLLVRRVGYESRGVDVTSSGDDTVTVWLKPLPQILAPAVVEAERVRRLEVAGFYQRKEASGAPPSRFITAKDIERMQPTLLSDLRFTMGLSQPFSRCAVYIDGSPVILGASRGNTYRSGLDADIQPSDVEGLEYYRIVEAPAQFAPTQRPRRECVLVIWLK